mmetsp:Transcript_50018/g.116857  ORF Transcript_50018/g.116857 Transcript_50018/m.116857 type:complete len:211 (-) Transcript_50018:2984-3616(-)
MLSNSLCLLSCCLLSSSCLCCSFLGKSLLAKLLRRWRRCRCLRFRTLCRGLFWNWHRIRFCLLHHRGRRWLKQIDVCCSGLELDQHTGAFLGLQHMTHGACAQPSNLGGGHQQVEHLRHVGSVRNLYGLPANHAGWHCAHANLCVGKLQRRVEALSTARYWIDLRSQASCDYLEVYRLLKLSGSVGGIEDTDRAHFFGQQGAKGPFAATI